MKTYSNTKNEQSPFWKTMTCILLSMFYFAMLAYPFGVSKEGYMVNQALIAGVVFFAISIPAWIINVKREFYGSEEEVTEAQEVARPAGVIQRRKEISMNVRADGNRMGELAVMKKWLTPKEIKQILFCQQGESAKMFGEIAVKRNYLSQEQVNTLLAWQPHTLATAKNGA